ncbi:MAG: peptidoglycan DD-metalloendopeptidase family protein [Saprospiraceae bacterium]
MARTKITRYVISMLFVLMTAFAIDSAKSLHFLSPQNQEQACQIDDCHKYLHWDLGIVGIETLKLRPNDVLGQLLSNRGVEYFKINQLIEAAKSIFPFRSIRAGKDLTIVSDLADSSIQALVYEPDPYRQILFHLDDSVRVEVINKDVEVRTETSGGVIDQSLWVSMSDLGLPMELIASMENALGWSVDFYHIQKGDEFQLIYERKYVDGQPLGIQKLVGARYTSGNTVYNSILYKGSDYEGYFDLEGRPMKKAFLKSPVEYARISSCFNMTRFHPILKRVKPHLGTDYAAPCGTPIRAVADGRITAASFTSGNGNFVKIKHDKTYDTQYLHMSRFGSGIHPGVLVKQGQTIGYIGQTGLATGCHVCFRFWKNGKQVNPINEKMPPPAAMDLLQLPGYLEYSKGIKEKLDKVIIINPADHRGDEGPAVSMSKS